MKPVILALGLALAMPLVAMAQSVTVVPATATAADSGSFWDRALRLQNGPVVLDAACCKICTKGKACGDSCISRSYTCHKAPGCACNG